MTVNVDLPHFVHRKTAKGKTYYYFAVEQGRMGTARYVRLPDPSDPLFATRVAELYKRRWPPVREKTRQILEQRVYFIGAEGGAIKIGMSNNPEARCRDMQIGSPQDVRVLATTSGGRRLERAYHQRFEYAHLRGEWFNPHPDILAEIERLNATGTKQETDNSWENRPDSPLGTHNSC